MEKKPAKGSGRRGSDKPKPEEKPPVDWSAYMFGGYNADQDIVSLYRMTPKEHQGVPCAGWLDDIGPGVDERYIRDNFGGGNYRLNKRSKTDGQIKGTCSLDIPGFPKVVTSAVDPKKLGEDLGAGAQPVMLKVGDTDVPFDGDLERFRNYVMVLKSLENIFPPKPDINAMLLEMALKREPTPDPIQQILLLKEAAGLLGGGSEPGANVYDLIKEAMSQAGPVIQAMMSPGVRRIARTRPGKLLGPGAGIATGPVPVGKGNGSDETVDITPEGRQVGDGDEPIAEDGTVSQRDLILQVAGTIVSCWKLDPPKDLAGTIRMVDLILQQKEPGIRKALSESFSQTILDVCETQLADEWSYPESTVGKRPEFQKFVKELFVEYARPDREVQAL